MRFRANPQLAYQDEDGTCWYRLPWYRHRRALLRIGPLALHVNQYRPFQTEGGRNFSAVPMRVVWLSLGRPYEFIAQDAGLCWDLPRTRPLWRRLRLYPHLSD